jgi:hypothetical protein
MKTFNLNDKILSLIQYEPKKIRGRNIFSGSMVSSSILQNFFRVKHGVIEKDKIDASAFGSLIHLGLEHLESDTIEVEKEFSIQYNDDWYLTCTIDLIDHEQKVIADTKITKRYTYEKFSQDSGYANQLRLNKYIASEAGSKCGDYDIWLMMFLKDYEGNYKTKEIDMLQYVWIDPDYNILDIVDEHIKVIDEHLKNDTIPSEDYCNRWEYGFIQNESGTREPKKCKKYCSYNKICPYFREDTRSVNIVNSWL